MTQTKTQLPAKEGWIDMNFDHPHLLGSQCKHCRSYCFPKETMFCKNPSCESTEFEVVPLSRRGKIWSYTNSAYQPPPPYVAAEPFVPFALAAVELQKDKMTIIGQLAKGVTVQEVKVGMEVELILEPLFEDEKNQYIIWKWKPVAA